MLWLLLIAGGGLLIASGLYWLIIITEGVYLGQNLVTYLYDQVAYKYDAIKEYGPADEYYFLSVPLAQAVGYDFEGIILDVAAGTGRVANALAQLPEFQGQVIGLDHSAKMLAVARQKMPDLPLVQANAMRLPFASNAVEVVTCLEALEFLPRPATGVAEMARVLAPGGILLTTNRVGLEAKLMPGKALPEARLIAILKAACLDDIAIRIWETIDSFNIKAEKDAELEAYIEAQLNLPLIRRLIAELTTSRYQKIWARKPNPARPR